MGLKPQDILYEIAENNAFIYHVALERHLLHIFLY
jgi:hypothetical protein